MNESEIDELKKLLKDSLPTVQGIEPRRDLWPEMRRRLDHRPFHVPWWDWALLAGAAVFLCVFPGLIPVLFYHL